MKLFRSFLEPLLPHAPVQVLDDPVLGALKWDSETKSWISPPVEPANRYDFQIDRYKRLPTPPEDCVRVAHRLAGDPERLDWLLRVVLGHEADRRPEPLRAGILRLSITRITLRSDSGRVRGEMWLDGEPPLFNWSCWHSDGIPVGAGPQWES